MNGDIALSKTFNYSDKERKTINEYLPNDLILRIFSYLDIKSLSRASQVNKYWHELAFDGCNWRRINLKEFQCEIRPTLIIRISQICQRYLRHLNLRGCIKITDESVDCFTKHCPLIETLVLSECPQLTDNVCKSIGENCHWLTGLMLDSSAGITDQGLKYLVQDDTSFDLVDTYSSSTSSCDELDEQGVAGCATTTTLVQAAVVGGTGADFKPPVYTRRTHQLGIRQLQVLDISWCTAITDLGLGTIARACHSLQKLRCLGCSHITASGFTALFENCPDLLLLNANYCKNGITDESLIRLAQNCPNLHQLSVGYCNQLTDRGVRAITSKCPELNIIELSCCFQITDSGVIAIAKSCPQLHKLDLEECSQITDLSLRALADNCPCLDSLILSHCDQITDEGVRRLASSVAGRHCLRHLALDNCSNISDLALDCLGLNSLSLAKLDVFDCQAVSRIGLKRLHERLRGVQTQAYFAPQSLETETLRRRRRYCRCCSVL